MKSVQAVIIDPMLVSPPLLLADGLSETRTRQCGEMEEHSGDLQLGRYVPVLESR